MKCAPVGKFFDCYILCIVNGTAAGIELGPNERAIQEAK